MSELCASKYSEGFSKYIWPLQRHSYDKDKNSTFNDRNSVHFPAMWSRVLSTNLMSGFAADLLHLQLDTGH